MVYTVDHKTQLSIKICARLFTSKIFINILNIWYGCKMISTEFHKERKGRGRNFFLSSYARNFLLNIYVHSFSLLPQPCRVRSCYPHFIEDWKISVTPPWAASYRSWDLNPCPPESGLHVDSDIPDSKPPAFSTFSLLNYSLAFIRVT